MQLTQKENTLLKDLITHEQLCIDKYNRYSSEAKDCQLKDLFTEFAKTEQQHYDTLTQINNGTVPAMEQGGGTTEASQFMASYTSETPEKQQDKFLCTDALSTEKQVSSVYNTVIFEFTNADIRNALNHIQKEEQQHGERLYNYMSVNGMYQVQ